MEFIKQKLNGVYEIKLKPLGDSRGFFMRTYDDHLFSTEGLNYKWVQENQSRSVQKGIIRGLHLQLPPFSETKLIRALKGEVLDLFVDLREGSETFGKWGSVLLSENLFNYVLVPRGFAHAICTLTEFCEISYKVDNYYSPEHEIGIIWNDKDINIEWPVSNPILSSKDQNNIKLKEFVTKIGAIKV